MKTKTLFTIIILSIVLTSCTPAEKKLGIGSTQTREKDGMLMVYVPEGTFAMGSDEDAEAENPTQTVTLDAFWIDQTEVTNAMFQVFMQTQDYQTDAEKIGKSYVLDLTSKSWWQMDGANWQHPQGQSSSLAGLSEYPVVQVSWNDASAYCAWAGGRLPSEAEWEKAARGTDGRIYPWGDTTPNGIMLNFADANLDVSWANNSTVDGYQGIAPVGSYLDGASPYGTLDMAGNVWEWVNDWYDVYPDGDKAASSDFGRIYRVLRGGSWDYEDTYSRSTFRLRGTPYDSGGNIGFRCARSQ